MRDSPVANPWLAAVEPSPIGETKRWVLGRTFPPDRPLIDLSQAVPGYPPALQLRQHQAVVELEGPVVQRAHVGEDVVVLADGDEALGFVGMAEVREDDFDAGEFQRDRLDEARQCEGQRRLRDEGVI